jgi:hypothetical protein
VPILASLPWEDLTWGESYFWAVVVVGIVLLATAFIGPAPKRSLLLGMVMGKDNRWSTSRVTATMWTFTVIWALLCILFKTHGVGQNGLTIPDQIAIVLGLPLAGAVGARATNAGRPLVKEATGVTTNRHQKTKKDTPQLAPTGIFTGDDDEVSLMDSQYFLFSLVLLAWFVTAFVAKSDAGIPTLPDSLLGLSSASGAAYLAKKGLERTDVAPAGKSTPNENDAKTQTRARKPPATDEHT